MIRRLPHPVLGAVVFLSVWATGAFLIGFGVGVPEIVGLTLVAAAGFARVNRRPG